MVKSTTVGAFEAKTHFSALLERVAAGEEVLITKHGKTVARLVPANDKSRDEVLATIEKIRAFRKGKKLGADWKTFKDEGRP